MRRRNRRLHVAIKESNEVVELYKGPFAVRVDRDFGLESAGNIGLSGRMRIGCSSQSVYS